MLNCSLLAQVGDTFSDFILCLRTLYANKVLGMHGLAMAKTYLQVFPEAKITIVEKAKSLGGSWAAERLYPGLKTNNLFGSYEFGDVPMIPERYGAKPGGHIPGNVVHAYFCEAAARYKIDECIHYETNVDSAELQKDGRWKVRLSSIDKSKSTQTIMADKLVVATGLTSEPYIPSIPGMDSFRGLIVHSKQLKEQADNLTACKEVVVLGGNKSSWDVCYAAARSGSQVHMVIRPTGGGPSYLWPKTFTMGPFTLSLASMSSSRIFTLFDPTPFAKASIIRWFLHRTTVGGKLCRLFWEMLDARVKSVNGYDSHPELKKLKPWITPFWMGNSLGVHNYDTDWFELVRQGKIHVHIAEVDCLSDNTVTLTDGTLITADALVCCTGWKADPTVPISQANSTANVTRPKQTGTVELEAAQAEAEIYRKVAYLRKLPRRTPNAPSLKSQGRKRDSAPQQLYRLMTPWQPSFLDGRNLAFIGAHSSPHAVAVAQAQALWITAFFNGDIQHLQQAKVNHDAVRYNAILHGIYGQIRRPKESGGAGSKYPDLVFDSFPYIDTLLADLGLQTMRKSSWGKEMFEPYRPQDYKDLVEEWVAKQRAA